MIFADIRNQITDAVKIKWEIYWQKQNYKIGEY